MYVCIPFSLVIFVYMSNNICIVTPFHFKKNERGAPNIAFKRLIYSLKSIEQTYPNYILIPSNQQLPLSGLNNALVLDTPDNALVYSPGQARNSAIVYASTKMIFLWMQTLFVHILYVSN